MGGLLLTAGLLSPACALCSALLCSRLSACAAVPASPLIETRDRHSSRVQCCCVGELLSRWNPETRLLDQSSSVNLSKALAPLAPLLRRAAQVDISFPGRRETRQRLSC